jgi:hypothetical protein
MPNTIKPLPPMSAADIARFWSRVDKTPGFGPHGDCWKWTLALNADGYGQMKIKRDNFRASRIAHLIQSGTDPIPLLICHACDWRACVRGDHLFPGTTKDNTDDMLRKGRIEIRGSARANAPKHGWPHFHAERMARGERIATSKLTENKVREMRALYADGMTSADLGRMFNVTPENASYVCRRVTWKHVV